MQSIKWYHFQWSWVTSEGHESSTSNKCIGDHRKPPLAASRCCHLANDLTKFRGDRLYEQTDKQTNRQTGHRHGVKPLHLRVGGLLRMKSVVLRCVTDYWWTELDKLGLPDCYKASNEFSWFWSFWFFIMFLTNTPPL